MRRHRLLTCSLIGLAAMLLLIPGAAPPPALPAWSQVNDFVYQLQNINPAAVGRTKFDVVITDYARDGDDATRLTPAQVNAMRYGSGGPKRVLCYMSIGEAETYRWYWRNRWDADHDGQPDAAAPSWLDEENPDWDGNYKVRFWDPGWQQIVLAYVDKAIDAGFDGVYLDIIDAYEYWGPDGSNDRPTAARDMVNLVRLIARHARQVRGKHQFAVFPQNGEYLGRFPTYLAVVNGIGREDVWYDGNTPQSSEDVAWTLGELDRFKAAGKLVMVVDYPTQKWKVDRFYGLAKAKGYVPYAAVRDLDRLLIPRGHAPD